MENENRETPLVSVVTVSYNSEKTIARTFDAMLAQTYPRVEYWLIDGASTDGTLAVADAYRARFAEKGYDFHIISEPDNGMYDALNKGVAYATGDLIGQINSDDYYEPQAISRMVDVYRETGFDYFYADLRVVSPKKSKIKRARYRRFASTRYWNHPTTFIRADLYKSHPYSLMSMYDDYELILRLRREGRRAAVLNEVLANFTFGEGMSTRKSWAETKRRIGWRRANYRKNGYGFIYTIDSAMIEIIKYFWG